MQSKKHSACLDLLLTRLIQLRMQLDQAVPGFKSAFGGEELKRASATLNGAISFIEREKNAGVSLMHGPGSPIAGAACAAMRRRGAQPPRWPCNALDSLAPARCLKPSLILCKCLVQTPLEQLTEHSDLQVRELAFTARQYGTATAQDPSDYDAYYHHGLVLQVGVCCIQSKTFFNIAWRRAASCRAA